MLFVLKEALNSGINIFLHEDLYGFEDSSISKGIKFKNLSAEYSLL